MHDDLLVVGFDLTTGREVHIAEQPAAHWRRLGYGAAEALVCFYCFHGFEAPVGTRVPLLTRGRVGGQVRTHFAHPSGRAPAGGHNPETVWHLTANAVELKLITGSGRTARVCASFLCAQ